MWLQRLVRLKARPRGFHLITEELILQLPELQDFKVGLCHLLLQHTSASLSLNENADPTVRADLEAHLNKMIPENAPYFQHTYEGADDMPAHIKSSLLGSQITLPVNRGEFALGIWQGIYLGEHRNDGGNRQLIATISGE
ncbi:MULTISPECIES: secondary thiamine-phosphate synthase enzyme YjbQ [unclassified Agarivorans]|uniref:secondary thiamine-phosphate synthase enzyme YjbQ n=1 Tax=unclassified Agarivorans TaxID=2636026 RepID=UPI0026E47E11|nr:MULTISPECIES: secondary thiamine-phosphate synthase enzyme YjbQ [unclassified Agarivorans]MDO6685611.1 secondary thiamine-phosphate synthase enzyme YjbQ [Agarivorans sp. 3_MG-2023]MDO6715997.1 secondary thiamine-phosphate synthase enzyme YjbQ [Agarivorans sp. 2_MG-2023]MDO6766160.1 secondary thiamine-phosphate synthase enzyme YjbQ [Agarivorans sp. 1_MG-2023]